MSGLNVKIKKVSLTSYSQKNVEDSNGFTHKRRSSEARLMFSDRDAGPSGRQQVQDHTARVVLTDLLILRDAEYCIDREANGRKRDGMFRYQTLNTFVQYDVSISNS